MEGMLRSFLEKRCDLIEPKNLDLTVFIVGHTIEALTHGAMLDRPELLNNKQLEQKITMLLSSYLAKKRSDSI
jgi:hypothetical protein